MKTHGLLETIAAELRFALFIGPPLDVRRRHKVREHLTPARFGASASLVAAIVVALCLAFSASAAVVQADRVRETTTTSGTGSYALGGAAVGFRTFLAGIGNGNQCYYTTEDGTSWEVGLGTLTGATTLSRDTILASSNAGAAVSWPVGGKRNIFVGPVAAAFNSKANTASPTFSGTVTGTFSGNLTGNVTGNASTATALQSVPTQCGANNFATGVAASGNANCSQPSAANLSNGTTGSGAVVLAAGPTFTGTPAAPTAAVDTNTTQVATTAYVIAQGYLKSATAASTYAPIASPTFTGHPTIEGVTSTGATGTGKLVFDGSPTFTGTATIPVITGPSGVVNFRDGLNPQQLRIFNTYTDASNYESGEIVWTGSTFILRTAALGTGTQRAMTLDSGGFQFAIGGVNQWTINSAGLLYPAATTNTVDLGTSGHRVRSGYFGTSVDVAGAFGSTTAISLNGTGATDNTIMSLASGDGTTSARQSYVRYFANETAPQAWKLGLLGSKDFSLVDTTASKTRLVFRADVPGMVGINSSPSNGTLDVRPHDGQATASIVATASNTTGSASFTAFAGDGTTSSRSAFAEFRTAETSPARWVAGLQGTKDWWLRDITNARTIISVSETDGSVKLNGTVIAAPSAPNGAWTFAGTGTPGMSYASASGSYWTTGGTSRGFLHNSGIRVASNYRFEFSNANDIPGSAPDASIDRLSAGVLNVGNGLGGNGALDVAGGDLRVKGQSLQSFTLIIRNNAGTLEEQVIANGGGATSNFVSKITGTSSGFQALPTVDSTHAFTFGVGIDAASTQQLLLNTAAQTDADAVTLAAIEYNTSGTALTVRCFNSSSNVNGSTVNRIALVLRNAATGGAFTINTTNLTAGNQIAIRFIGYIK